MASEAPDNLPVLNYSHHLAANERRGRWLIPAFIVGQLSYGILMTALAAALLQMRDLQTAALGAAVIALTPILPASLSLGIAVWLRQTLFGATQFRGLLQSALWGLAGGLIGSLLSVFLANQIYLLLAWYLLFPAAAGYFLCFRGADVSAPNYMLRRRYRRWCIAAALLTAALVVIGYVSASMSQEACEVNTARWLLHDATRSATIRFIKHDASPDTQRILMAAGATTGPRTAPSTFPRLILWLDLSSATVDAPFIDSVKYGSVTQPDVAAGGRRRFICFFGFVIDWYDEIE